MRCRFFFTALLIAAVHAVMPAAAGAQEILRNCNVAAQRQEQVREDNWLVLGEVEIECGDTKLYADRVEAFTAEDRVIAKGNVAISQGDNRLASDHAEFNTRTKLGTFYDAYGIAAVKPSRQTPSAGFTAPQIAGQDTDVYFFGRVVEKVGPRKYKISDGGFSTCVQPTPRWDLHADTITLEIDNYTLLQNAILRVKGVPLLYVPILYYPTKEEERATGFLLPTYGMSSLQGQSLSNQFFWAIDRSQDATFEHDWYSKIGQGYGGEYRYNLGSGDGSLRSYVLNRTVVAPGSLDGASTRSYELRGGANQAIGRSFRARGYVDYFSSIASNQIFYTNIADASRSQRRYGGNLIGAWRGYSLNATYDRSEYFPSVAQSIVAGSAPRVAFSRGERPLLARSPHYFSFATEYVPLERSSRRGVGLLFAFSPLYFLFATL
jgi:LPS-assembly protein